MYSSCCESPLAVLLELFHDRVSSKGLEEAPGRTRLSWRRKLRLPQSGECCICIHFAIKYAFDVSLEFERYPFCFVFGPKRSWCPPYTQRQKPEGKLFTFFRILHSILGNITELASLVCVAGSILRRRSI